MNDQTTLIITAIVNKENMAELPVYLEKMQPLFAAHGAKPVAKYKVTENLGGEESPEIINIIAFENAEAVKGLIASDEFKALSELRARVFNKLNIVLSQS